MSFVAVTVLLTGALAPPHLNAQTASDASTVRATRLILRVSDLAASTAFYRDRVGLKLQMINDEFAVFDGGGVLLMLEVLAKPPAGPSTGLAAFTEVVLESPDVFATYAAMESRGVTFRSTLRAVTADENRDLYAADFRDPNGHVISIAGWKSR
jgi:catechol 2,3-dioxygenase-like lactoylglutathione lyase family enzyme